MDGIWLVLLCEMVQAGRRLYECMMLEDEGKNLKASRDKITGGKGNGEIVIKKQRKGKEGESRMHLGIYVFGMLFYGLLAIAVWVDSAGRKKTSRREMFTDGYRTHSCLTGSSTTSFLSRARSPPESPIEGPGGPPHLSHPLRHAIRHPSLPRLTGEILSCPSIRIFWIHPLPSLCR